MRKAPIIHNIILEGNSIPNQYSSALNTALQNQYGAGNYSFTNVSGNGENIDEMSANWQTQIQNNIRGFSLYNIVIIQELRNQMLPASGNSTPAATFTKLKSYVQSIRNAMPEHVVLKIVVVTAIADNDVGSDIDVCNDLIRNDTSGDFDLVIDLYNHSTFSDYTSSLFEADETHPSTLGETTAGNFIASQVNTAYP